MAEEKKYTREELEDVLNAKNKKFCYEYINDWNKVRSYMKAYPDSSYNAAAVSAHDLLKNPKILQFIDFIKDDIAKNIGISKQRLIDELRKIAFSSISRIHDTWITRKEFNEISDDDKSAIQEIDSKIKYEVNQNTKKLIEVEYVKVKLYDKKAAIQEILKSMGWNEPDRIDLSTLGEKITGMEIK